MRSRIITGLLALAVLLCWAQGVVLQRAVLRDADGVDDRGRLLTGAGVGTTTAVLLLAAMVVGLSLHPRWWLLVVTAVGVGSQVALAVVGAYRAGSGNQVSGPAGATGGLGRGLLAGVLEPGSWLLIAVLVVLVVAAVRDRSRPGPPAPPGR